MQRTFLDLKGYRLLLGSKSPRRKDILKAMCLEFDTCGIDADENYPDRLDSGRGIAEYLAEKKSKAYRGELSAMDVLVTADTVVVKDGKVLHKPESKSQAVDMIASLQNTAHEVVSGACLRGPGRMVVFSESTRVEFGALDLDEIRWYVDGFSPLDKAGAYGIQEWIGYAGVARIEGSYYNVMGFPTYRFYQELKKWTSR